MKELMQGAFIAMPVTAAITYFVLLSDKQIDTKIERAEVKSELVREKFDKDFDQKWSVLEHGSTSCTSSRDQKIEALEKRLASLQSELARTEKAGDRNLSNLDSIVNEHDSEEPKSPDVFASTTTDKRGQK